MKTTIVVVLFGSFVASCIRGVPLPVPAEAAAAVEFTRLVEVTGGGEFSGDMDAFQAEFLRIRRAEGTPRALAALGLDAAAELADRCPQHGPVQFLFSRRTNETVFARVRIACISAGPSHEWTAARNQGANVRMLETLPPDSGDARGALRLRHRYVLTFDRATWTTLDGAAIDYADRVVALIALSDRAQRGEAVVTATTGRGGMELRSSSRFHAFYATQDIEPVLERFEELADDYGNRSRFATFWEVERLFADAPYLIAVARDEIPDPRTLEALRRRGIDVDHATTWAERIAELRADVGHLAQIVPADRR